MHLLGRFSGEHGCMEWRVLVSGRGRSWTSDPMNQVADMTAAQEAVAKVFRKCDETANEWVQTSEVSRLNSAGAGESVEFGSGSMARRALRIAAEGHKGTGGLFDPTVVRRCRLTTG